MINYLRTNLGKHGDVVLVLSMVGILMILFTPIPSQLLDLLIIANFSFGLLILLLTFYVDKPIQFSTFPSLLLIATLFRLSLNIASTRLILNETNAGQVIDAVGEFVVSGNYVIGLIVFLVLIVVQYVVVTNGAQRVAEVAARFTLDSMPGKQMSIDADLNVGIIDEKEAQIRRRDIEREGSFYGAMDGASKFVKGDAIAGIVIIIINIIGGLTIGIAQSGMSWGEALQTYTLLTVGDGIVTQIPALIISTGTGIIVTRAGSDAYLSQEIANQITRFPKALLMILIGLLAMIFLPGIPSWPIIIMASIVGLLTWYSYKSRAAGNSSEESDSNEPVEEATLYQQLKVDRLLIEYHPSISSLFTAESGEIVQRLMRFRDSFALESGLILPAIKYVENSDLAESFYSMKINGVGAAEADIRLGSYLAINPGNAKGDLAGEETKDPSYGLAAKWIASELREEASNKGYTVVDAPSVAITHLTEQVRKNACDLLSRAEVERLIESVKVTNSSLIDELVPGTMSIGLFKKVLQQLLQEEVSIRNVELIAEALVDEGKQVPDASLLVEIVRRFLGPEICQKLAGESGVLHTLVLDPSIEKTVNSSIAEGQLLLDARFSEQMILRLASQVERMMRENKPPVLIVAPELRRYLAKLVKRMIPHLKVLSMNEVPQTVKVKSFALVTV